MNDSKTQGISRDETDEGNQPSISRRALLMGLLVLPAATLDPEPAVAQIVDPFAILRAFGRGGHYPHGGGYRPRGGGGRHAHHSSRHEGGGRRHAATTHHGHSAGGGSKADGGGKAGGGLGKADY